MRTGLLFPGQGSQFVGMGRDLAERFPQARDTFAEADDVLGMDLSGIAWEGPAEKLTRTENAQPALYVHSMAVHRILAGRIGEVTAAAGHSLGELSAHAAARTWSFADGLRAVRRRGELMARADAARPGSMAAVLGLRESDIEALCDEARRAGRVLVAANLNADGQVVVSGEIAAIQWAAGAARNLGAKRVVPLSVSAAFHSPLMEPMAESFAEVLAGMPLRRPDFPVVSNVTGAAPSEPEAVRSLLARQLTSPVRWIDCINRLAELGVERYLEVGPGRVLTGLNRRNARGAPTQAVGTAAAVEKLL